MAFLEVGAGLAVLTAIGHSTLSERMFLARMRAETVKGMVFSSDVAKRLATAMFHAASLTWVTMAITMLLLDAQGLGSRTILQLFAGVFALFGVGNFWAIGHIHPGGVMLLATSGCVVASLLR